MHPCMTISWMLLGWWNGRHEGLKILWPLRLCGFKSRSEYSQSLTVNQLAIIFLSKMSLRWSYGMYEEGQ